MALALHYKFTNNIFNIHVPSRHKSYEELLRLIDERKLTNVKAIVYVHGDPEHAVMSLFRRYRGFHKHACKLRMRNGVAHYPYPPDKMRRIYSNHADFKDALELTGGDPFYFEEHFNGYLNAALHGPRFPIIFFDSSERGSMTAFLDLFDRIGIQVPFPEYIRELSMRAKKTKYQGLSTWEAYKERFGYSANDVEEMQRLISRRFAKINLLRKGLGSVGIFPAQHPPASV